MTMHTMKQTTHDVLRKVRTRHPKTSHFLWETYRLWVPLVLAGLILWYFEALNDRYQGEDWLRSLAKLKHMSLGFIFGHVTWSVGFPYLKCLSLFKGDKETFRAVIQARVFYYSACVLAAVMGL